MEEEITPQPQEEQLRETTNMAEVNQMEEEKEESVGERCLNCSTVLTGLYCSVCGQKDLPQRQTLGELFSNFISSFWSYEGKFFLTSKFLILRPGFLATEYAVGRRERYYHPARMYVFISFIFFLAMVSLPDATEKDKEMALKEAGERAYVDSLTHIRRSELANIMPPAIVDSIAVNAKKNKSSKNLNIRLGQSNFKSIREYDSTQLTLPEGERNGWIKRRLNYRAIELNQRYKNGAEFTNEFKKALNDNFPKVIFFLLPIFALLLKLLYVRRDFFYSEHLVFSIYSYNFFFLAGTLYMLAAFVSSQTWVTFSIGLWICIYLLLAMKRMYQQSWLKTILKYFMFIFMFLVCMVIVFSMNAMIVLLLL